MKWDEILVILLISLVSVSFSYAVINTAKNTQEIRLIKEQEEQKRERLRKHLPSVCAQYYDAGTDEWKECMGVGYK